jgi:hypothetical protein
MYVFCSKLACLSELACLSKLVNVVTDSRKDTSLLVNLSVYCKLQERNILYYKPLGPML